jgi:hypothetical protein
VAVKGFVKTLEAVLASLLVISSAVIFAPQIGDSPERSFNNLYEDVSSLEKNDRLDSNITEAEREVSKLLPQAFNVRIQATKNNITRIKTDSNSSEVELEGAEGRRIQIFNQDGVTDVEYNSTELISVSRSYASVIAPNDLGTLNVSSTGVSSVIVHDSYLKGSNPEVEGKKAVFPVIQPDKNRRLVVYIWQS